jgi:DNA-binding PadR family transcriptional regulator
MTYLLDDLEAAGLIERKPDPTDRRARRIVLTEAGLGRLCELERRLRDAEEGLLRALAPEERELFRGLLRRLAVACGEHSADACSVVADLKAEEAASVRGRRRPRMTERRSG